MIEATVYNDGVLQLSPSMASVSKDGTLESIRFNIDKDSKNLIYVVYTDDFNNTHTRIVGGSKIATLRSYDSHHLIIQVLVVNALTGKQIFASQPATLSCNKEHTIERPDNGPNCGPHHKPSKPDPLYDYCQRLQMLIENEISDREQAIEDVNTSIQTLGNSSNTSVTAILDKIDDIEASHYTKAEIDQFIENASSEESSYRDSIQTQFAEMHDKLAKTNQSISDLTDNINLQLAERDSKIELLTSRLTAIAERLSKAEETIQQNAIKVIIGIGTMNDLVAGITCQLSLSCLIDLMNPKDYTYKLIRGEAEVFSWNKSLAADSSSNVVIPATIATASGNEIHIYDGENLIAKADMITYKQDDITLVQLVSKM